MLKVENKNNEGFWELRAQPLKGKSSPELP